MDNDSTNTEKPPKKWLKIAIGLILFTIIYNVLEGAVSIVSGLISHRLSLVSFGLDSVIEVVAAAAMLWQLEDEIKGKKGPSDSVVDKIIGVTLLVLSVYILIESSLNLINQEKPENSIIGIIISILSILIMPALSVVKIKAAKEIKSKSLHLEAMETIACSYQSITLLIGLIVTGSLGWWWADAVAALLMVPWLTYQGIKGLTGKES